ncbi:MAG: PH domain-containing protein, partial [Bacteroidota bacterium]
MKFTASFDSFSKIVTAIVVMALIGVSVASITNNHGFSYFSIGLIVFMALALVVTYGFHPRFYVVNNGTVQVKSLFRSFTYPKGDISSCDRVDDATMKYSIRTFGVGGFFGYFGKFYNSKIGSMIWFATQRKNWVLMQTRNGKNIIITPDEPDALI